MGVRDTVWIHLEGKLRPGVIIEVDAELARVAYGTSVEHPGWPQVVVHSVGRAGRAFPLRETTYFYGANTASERASDLIRGQAPCLRDLFLAIRELVDAWDKAL